MSTNGQANKNIEKIYERWGRRGGIGMILSGDVRISYTGLESVGDPIVPPNAPLPGPRFNGFAAMARAGKAHGSLMVAQVYHSGHLCVFVKSPVCASEVEVSNEGKGRSLQ